MTPLPTRMRTYFGYTGGGALPAANFGSANGSSGFVTATGNCDETMLAAGSLYGNVYSYDQSNGASCNVAGWKVEAASNAIVAGKGYSRYVKWVQEHYRFPALLTLLRRIHRMVLTV